MSLPASRAKLVEALRAGAGPTSVLVGHASAAALSSVHQLVVSGDCEFLASSAQTLFTLVQVSMPDSAAADAFFTVTLTLPDDTPQSDFVGKTVRFRLARELRGSQRLRIRLVGSVAYGYFAYDAPTFGTSGSPTVRSFTFHPIISGLVETPANAVGDWVQFCILSADTVLYTGAFARGNPMFEEVR